MNLSRCAHPKVRSWSTYTVLGFLGYGLASIFASALAFHWDFTLGERVVVLIAPPVAFIAVVTVATAIKGGEWIVFYQATAGAIAAVIVAGAIIDARVWRLLDVAVLGIGLFLVFGRLGCFSVACCHGRLAKRGVAYGPAHVAVGFWRRWQGRTLFPVQLVESAGSMLLVATGLLASAAPGRAAVVYAVGYACLRFGLELLRGDRVRPHGYGVSEAQWSCLAVGVLCAIAWPAIWTIAPLIALAAAIAYLVRSRRRFELVQGPHLKELDSAFAAILDDPAHARRDTSLGVAVSFHKLPDGRADWILSSTHPAWSPAMARRLAHLLWPAPEIVEARTPGMVHVLTAED